MLHFQCPHCTGVFQADPTLAGQQVACPTCQGVVAIGAVEPRESATAKVETTAARQEPKSVLLTFPAPPPLPPRTDTAGTPAAPAVKHSDADTAPSVASTKATTADESSGSTGFQPGPARHLTGAGNSYGELLGCPRCSGTFQMTADMAGLQMACPHCGGAVTIPGRPAATSTAADAPPLVASGEGDALMAFRVKDAHKKIVLGDRVVEVRRFTPEEKARRRLVKRVVLIGFCTIVLIAAMLYLNYVGLR